MELSDWVSSALSLLAVLVSMLSLWRSTQTEKVVNRVRLQLAGNGTSFSTSDPIFTFHNELLNAGEKPVEITNVWMNIGAGDSDVRRYAYHLVGNYHLRPDEQLPLLFTLTRQQLEETRQNLGFGANEDCDIMLRVEYIDPNNKRQLVRRKVAALQPEALLSLWSTGEMLLLRLSASPHEYFVMPLLPIA